LAALGLSIILALNLKLDRSLGPFLPDGDPTLRRAAGLMDLAPFARMLLVQLSVEEPEEAWSLVVAAESLEAGLDRRLLAPWLNPDELPDPARLMELLPALCDKACRDRLASGLEPQSVRRRLEALKTSLAGLTGTEVLFWRADPLNWRGEVFGKLPNPQAGFRSDFLAGYPVSRDGRHLLIVLRPEASMYDAAGVKAVMDGLDDLLQALPTGVSARVVGAHRHSAANAEAIERDLALTLPLALGLLALLYMTLVRSFGALWLFLTPAVALLSAAAALAALPVPMVSALALGFGAAVLGIAEDYAGYVHFAMRRAPNRETALGLVTRPLFLSAVLCCAGFAVLMFSAVPAIRHLALFSMLAISAACLWALVALPHCPAIDQPREFRPAGLEPCAAPAIRTGWASGLFLALSAAVGLAALNMPKGGFSIRSLNFASPAIVDDQEHLARVWGGGDGGRSIFMAEGETEALSLALAGEVVDDLGQRGGTGINALSGLCPPPEAQKENLEAWSAFTAALPKDFQADFLAVAAEFGFASQAFEPFWNTLFGSPEIIVPDKLTHLGFGFLADYYLAERDGRHYALIEMSGPGPPLAEKFAGRVFRLAAPDLEEALSKALAGEKKLPIAAALICMAIMLAAFRNKAEAMAAFLPALAGLTAVLALSLIRGKPLGLVEAAALTLVIGLGADYGILVISENRGLARLGAGRAILVSGLSTAAGVGVLVLARHPVLKALGETMLTGLAAALPVAILGLPKLYRTPRVGLEKNSKDLC
jgi:predicted exporter